MFFLITTIVAKLNFEASTKENTKSTIQNILEEYGIENFSPEILEPANNENILASLAQIKELSFNFKGKLEEEFPGSKISADKEKEFFNSIFLSLGRLNNFCEFFEEFIKKLDLEDFSKDLKALYLSKPLILVSLNISRFISSLFADFPEISDEQKPVAEKLYGEFLSEIILIYSRNITEKSLKKILDK